VFLCSDATYFNAYPPVKKYRQGTHVVIGDRLTSDTVFLDQNAPTPRFSQGCAVQARAIPTSTLINQLNQTGYYTAQKP
jgi:hypothetical protein